MSINYSVGTLHLYLRVCMKRTILSSKDSSWRVFGTHVGMDLQDNANISLHAPSRELGGLSQPSLAQAPGRGAGGTKESRTIPVLKELQSSRG